MKRMRKVCSLNQEWYFKLGDDTASYLPKYDDHTWEVVHLPHNVEESPLNCSGGRNYQGICRYRKHFKVEKSQEGERVILEFEGAMHVLELWINGESLDTHYCGYTPAVYDITDYVNYGEENIIAVRLDNSDRSDVPPGKPQQDLDFTYEGGIYRGVKLYQMAPVHISHPILANKIAGGGRFITTSDVSKESAKVRIQTHVVNESTEAKEVLVQHEILDIKGQSILKNEAKISLDKGQDNENVQEMTVTNPHLWSPYDPYLYEVVTSIIIDGKVVDNETSSLGIRDFVYTTDRGFILNGEKIKVSGANYHQTFPYIGNAMSDNLLKRDARKYREAGMIHIRSHYPFAKSFMEECDRLGIMLIISNPGWQFFKKGIFEERSYQNMRDIIRWLRNHPCVILWEPGLNESNMPKYFMENVHDLVHEELPIGPCYTGSDSGYSDVVYRSFDPGMLGPKSEDYDPEAYMAMKQRFDKPRWVREYGDSPDNWDDHNCVWRVPRGWGEDTMIKQVRRMIWDKHDWMTNYTDCINDESLCGFGMWPGMEHNRGYHINPCWGGFLDLLRMPKYSYYFFKSQRNIDDNLVDVPAGPMIFIANYWADTSPDNITVYSNCEKVRLYHNDVLVEERQPDDVSIPHPPFTFQNDFYYGRERSTIRVEGLIGDKVVATDSRMAPGVPKKLHLYVDHEGLDLQADGSDMIVIRLDVHDDMDNITPLTLDTHDIVFEVEGPATIIGDKIKRAELGQAAVVIKATTEPGEITVKARLLHPQRYAKIAVKPATVRVQSK